ncbi:MAG: hypothetical protein H0W85_09490 [Methylotenera sp.]|nr:hypothetical protein [Methylotenera sp.]
MFNRLIFAFTLIVSFGMAQIGAVTHEISHYSDITAKNQQLEHSKSTSPRSKSKPSEPISHNQVCEKCISYAELGHAVHSTQPVLSAVNSTHHYSVTYLQTPSYSKLRSYSARAPPSLV